MIIFYTVPYIIPAMICICGFAGITAIFSFIANHPIIISVLYAPVVIFWIVATFSDDDCCLFARIYNAITTAFLQASVLLYIFGVSRCMLGGDSGLSTLILILIATFFEVLTHLFWMEAFSEWGTIAKMFTGTICAIVGALIGLAMLGY